MPIAPINQINPSTGKPEEKKAPLLTEEQKKDIIKIIFDIDPKKETKKKSDWEDFESATGTLYRIGRDWLSSCASSIPTAASIITLANKMPHIKQLTHPFIHQLSKQAARYVPTVVSTLAGKLATPFASAYLLRQPTNWLLNLALNDRYGAINACLLAGLAYTSGLGLMRVGVPRPIIKWTATIAQDSLLTHAALRAIASYGPLTVKSIGQAGITTVKAMGRAGGYTLRKTKEIVESGVGRRLLNNGLYAVPVAVLAAGYVPLAALSLGVIASINKAVAGRFFL
jgi:hypothetical protein